MFVRHLLAIVALPFTVTVLIPLWIAGRDHTPLVLGNDPPQILAQMLGLVLLTIGLVLFVASLHQFAVRGKGTLAPWDPPRHLVVAGPYRYVRNPMISGVLFILFGEASLLLSWRHLEWALTFLGINLIYIPLLEEPMLRDRFGNAYREYCRNVHRLVPRLQPWSPAETTESRREQCRFADD